MATSCREVTVAMPMVLHVLMLQWLFAMGVSGALRQHPLLPQRSPSGIMLAPLIQSVLNTTSPTVFSTILFVTNHNVTVDFFDNELPDSPYFFLQYRCIAPSNEFFYNDTCVFQSAVHKFEKEMKERTDVSKAMLAVLFLDIEWFEGQLYVLNELTVQSRMVDDDTKYLLILSAVPSQEDTRKIFLHLNFCGMEPQTQAIVWNPITDHFQMHNLRCQTPIKTVIKPRSMYNPVHQRSLFANYLLFLKDDESRLFKEIIHKKLPTEVLRTCVSHGETWEERQKPIYFEKNSADFGHRFVAKFLYPHFKNDFCFLVRRARQLTFMESLWLLFPPNAWALVCATAVGVSLTYVAVVARRGVVHGRLLLYTSAMLETVRSLVTGAYTDWAGRLVFVPLSVSVASLILSNGFCGDLASIFTVPMYDREINTLEDVGSEIDIFYYNMQEFDVRFFSWHSMSNLRGKIIEDMTFIEDLLHSERKAALLRQSEIQRIVFNPRYAEGGQSLLRQVPQCLFTPAYQGIELSQPNSFVPVLNSMVLRAIQAGLWVKLEKDALDKFFISLETTTLRATRSPFAESIEALNVEKIGGLFVTLVFVLTSWTFVFISEVLLHNVIQPWRKGKQRKTSNRCREFYGRVCCFGRRKQKPSFDRSSQQVNEQ